MKQVTKKILFPILRPVWRRAWYQIEARVAPLEARISSLDQLEAAWRTHIPSFLNAVATVPALSYEVAALSKRLDGVVEAHSHVPALSYEVAALSKRLDGVVEAHSHVPALSYEVAALSKRLDGVVEAHSHVPALEAHSQSIASLWERIEFVRREIMFEISHGSWRSNTPNGSAVPTTASRIISADKIAAARTEGRLRLNLGCGHIALPDYVNVDARDLPGVDVVADVGDLPFEAQSVDEIFSAHLIEHFPLEAVRRRLLPYWRSRLRSGGTFRAVTPDAAAMLEATAAGSMPFDDFREVIYGAQDYDGDYHFNLFTPESLHDLLHQAGFKDINVPVSARRNGKCFEFEIVASAP